MDQLVNDQAEKEPDILLSGSSWETVANFDAVFNKRGKGTEAVGKVNLRHSPSPLHSPVH